MIQKLRLVKDADEIALGLGDRRDANAARSLLRPFDTFAHDQMRFLDVDLGVVGPGDFLSIRNINDIETGVADEQTAHLNLQTRLIRK